MDTTLRPTTRAEAVYQAIKYRGQGRYKIGRGNGNRPWMDSPLDGNGLCDCSNLVHWLIGCVLNQGQHGYFNTDGMLYDAYGVTRYGTKAQAPNRMFIPVPAGENPLPGDILVRGGKFKRDEDGHLERVRAGHTGLVSQVYPRFSRGDDFTEEGYKHLRVVHCSTFGANIPPAIRETDASFWRGRGYLIRYLHFKGE